MCVCVDEWHAYSTEMISFSHALFPLFSRVPPSLLAQTLIKHPHAHPHTHREKERYRMTLPRRASSTVCATATESTQSQSSTIRRSNPSGDSGVEEKAKPETKGAVSCRRAAKRKANPAAPPGHKAVPKCTNNRRLVLSAEEALEKRRANSLKKTFLLAAAIAQKALQRVNRSEERLLSTVCAPSCALSCVPPVPLLSALAACVPTTEPLPADQQGVAGETPPSAPSVAPKGLGLWAEEVGSCPSSPRLPGDEGDPFAALKEVFRRVQS